MPGGIGRFDQLQLPPAFPRLDALLALNGVADFDVYEPVHTVPLGGSVDGILLVLPYAPHQVICHARAQRAVSLTGQDVHESTLRPARAGPSGNR